jgi:hypothetical protein
MRRLLAPLALLLVTSGCASSLIDRDPSCLGGDIFQKETAYLEYRNSGLAGGEKEVRALYCLGLIYSLPRGGLYDQEKAVTALESVVDLDPGGARAQHAGLLLDQWRERDRLAIELERLSRHNDFLLGQIAKIDDDAERAKANVADREEQIEELGTEISRIRQEIAELGTELEAREVELERIKKIDLEPPP